MIATSKAPTSTSAKKNVQSLENVPGTTSLPVARVQRIVKADKDIQMVNKEAIFAISIVTVSSWPRLVERDEKPTRALPFVRNTSSSG
jgi:DNA polymerase epsilon subunit 4